MSDDVSLLQRWRAGDKAAGEQLVQRHYRSIFQRIRKGVGGDGELAADLTQQVFLAAVDRRDEVCDFRRYLHGTTRFVLWEQYKRKPSSVAEPEPELARLRDPEHSMESVLVRKGDVKLLVEALQTLSIEEQLYLMWSIADGLTQPEIAAREGMTTPQINGKIHRARQTLRRRIELLSQTPEQREAVGKGFETWMQSLRRKAERKDES